MSLKKWLNIRFGSAPRHETIMFHVLEVLCICKWAGTAHRTMNGFSVRVERMHTFHSAGFYLKSAHVCQALTVSKMYNGESNRYPTPIVSFFPRYVHFMK